MLDNKGTIGKRILSNYMTTKQQDTTLGVSLAGYQIIDDKNVKLALANSEPFSLNTVRANVYKMFDYALMPVNGTVDYLKGNNGLFYSTVIAYKSPSKVRDLNTSNMVQIAANTFLEENLGTFWEKKEIEGKDYFIRENDDDINKLLESVALQACASINAFSFQRANMFEKGDEVDIYYMKDNKPIISKGKIVTDKGYTVSVRVNNKLMEVPVGSIVKKHMTQQDKNEVVDYLSRAYNPKDSNIDYASKFNEI